MSTRLPHFENTGPSLPDYRIGAREEACGDVDAKRLGRSARDCRPGRVEVETGSATPTITVGMVAVAV
jgi:hypothetical protein